jgi:TonB-linked SusC/RagA family outer membrane protein
MEFYYKSMRTIVLSLAIMFIGVLMPSTVQAGEAPDVQGTDAVGVVLDPSGSPVVGASVVVVGTTRGISTGADGRFSIGGVSKGSSLRISFVGYVTATVKWAGRLLTVHLEDNSLMLGDFVVTAMGIRRKEKSLTYATQKIDGKELTLVQDANFVNSLQGRVAGATITPSAGGAGGASKILLRGNKSILGNNAPLIVVDGIPMTNETNNQTSWGGGQALTYASATEGSDPLSMINPDDIETVNVLKGANAAALYGSAAANGVVMITTKKGKEGTLEVSVTSGITFDTPLLTPKIQNVYGSRYVGTSPTWDSWGGKLSDATAGQLASETAHLRSAGADDVSNFFRTGTTANNAISLSGGTAKIKTYFSFANSHANGMVPSNAYNRNAVAFRQNYDLFNKRLSVDVSLNYTRTKTVNRQGGGTALNPLYDLYTVPRNIDMGYYRGHYATQGKWTSVEHNHYVQNGSAWVLEPGTVGLEGVMQDWAYDVNTPHNNPYWLLRQNRNIQRTDRVNGYVSGRLNIIEGLDLQARVSVSHDVFREETQRYATTRLPVSYEDYGKYGSTENREDEIYTDYLLTYNRKLPADLNLSATAGYVGHTVKGHYYNLWTEATAYDGLLRVLPTLVNYFDEGAGGGWASRNHSNTSNWDQAALATAQVGWKDAVYVDGSYRRDWYRAFRQFSDRGTPDNYGYFSLGGNAIISQLLKLPVFMSYWKMRLSYSEVGNSIPNILYNKVTSNSITGSVSNNNIGYFENPVPEKTRSLEAGVEMSFFDSKLDVDLTYYNSAMHHSYLLNSSASGKAIPVNTGVIRNQGIEAMASYDFHLPNGFIWRTGANVSYNHNKIEKTYRNAEGDEPRITQTLAGGNIEIRYNEGGSYGDMYARDFERNADGSIKLNSNGAPTLSTDWNKMVYIGNMNSDWQLGWSNTFTYKDIQLFFLINGRIGGKVVSYTEAQLDKFGVSQRTANARLYAERNNLLWNGQAAMYMPDGNLAPVEQYYREIGDKFYPTEYVYNATNFRLRELSLGYTFRNLFGVLSKVSLNFVARNLFFFYKKAPVDPDVALSTQNGLSGFEVFNMPSSRSYGFSLKVDF